jgi:hypothetical protein
VVTSTAPLSAETLNLYLGHAVGACHALAPVLLRQGRSSEGSAPRLVPLQRRRAGTANYLFWRCGNAHRERAPYVARTAQATCATRPLLRALEAPSERPARGKAHAIPYMNRRQPTSTCSEGFLGRDSSPPPLPNYWETLGPVQAGHVVSPSLPLRPRSCAGREAGSPRPSHRETAASAPRRTCSPSGCGPAAFTTFGGPDSRSRRRMAVTRTCASEGRTRPRITSSASARPSRGRRSVARLRS